MGIGWEGRRQAGVAQSPSARSPMGEWNSSKASIRSVDDNQACKPREAFALPHCHWGFRTRKEPKWPQVWRLSTVTSSEPREAAPGWWFGSSSPRYRRMAACTAADAMNRISRSLFLDTDC